MYIIEASENPLKINNTKSNKTNTNLDPLLKKILSEKIKDKISKDEVISLKDLDEQPNTSRKKPIVSFDKYGNEEPNPGTDAYYIKHGLPFKELDPYD